jgi:molybdopterin/thiamine biosynthesis adenylyltransferase
MEQVSFLRHNAFFGPEDANDKTFNIIGVGATGSWAGLLAAKMGWHNFRIWDADVVETHNCPNQIYNVTHTGLKKVDAFEQVLTDFNSQVTVEKHDCFFTSAEHANLLDGPVFIAVDSLDARADIMSACKNNLFVDVIFETRMGFSHAELNILDPINDKQIDNYLSMLKTDNEVQESACNERIITTLTTIVASTLVHKLCDFYSSSRRDTNFASPSKTLFSLGTNHLTTHSIS